MRTVLSWNVNGIRAIQGKGFLDWLQRESPDVLCVQETKAMPEQLEASLLAPPGYRSLWQSAERRGYSGVAAFVRDEPLSVETLGVPEFDSEGRTQILRYPDVTIVNCYFPNSQEAGARLAYKTAFCEAVLEAVNARVAAGQDVILCGDYNIAHQPIDLENPKANERNPGYLPEERAWMDRFLAAGYVDTFRRLCPEPRRYTWWSYRFHAREKNVGWRIDYHLTTDKIAATARACAIYKDEKFSDHAPLSIDYDFPL